MSDQRSPQRNKQRAGFFCTQTNKKAARPLNATDPLFEIGNRHSWISAMSIDDNDSFGKRFGTVIATIPTDRRWAVLVMDNLPRTLKIEAIILTTHRILLLVHLHGRYQYLPQDHPDFLGVVASADPRQETIDQLQEWRQGRAMEAA